jgi:hypothetical protein
VGRVDQFVDQLRREFPGFRIVPKDDSRLSRLIDLGLRGVTLGRQRHYLTRYHTVIGRTLYVPRAWETMSDQDKLILLRHERVHLYQSRRFGSVLMAFMYLVPIFPLGLAWGRAKLEWEAYEETLRATAELKGIAFAARPELRDRIVSRFVGPDYGWMWPFRSHVNRWYDDALRRIQAGAPTTKTTTRVEVEAERPEG